ncbi:MAG: class I SAM-dependent methyltransferase [Anaerolineales bacterium]
MDSSVTPRLLKTPAWKDYELLDSGDGMKLERFGSCALVRPEAQAIWRRSLPPDQWDAADGIFKATREESGGHWQLRKSVVPEWRMEYSLSGGSARVMRFVARTTPGRHLGVFPEAASHWDFIAQALDARQPGARILNLFGYTGLASLAAAAGNAAVTHVDASKKAVSWARENQSLSNLQEKHIRWIVDDALKFALREVRRGARYEGIILEPPKFGRGPKGEVWEIYKSLPRLMDACRQLLSSTPIFLILTLYAVRASPIHLAQMIAQTMDGSDGVASCGELVTGESSAGRLLSQAAYARWIAA